MLTLVESLDALLLMREFDLFQDAMEKLKPLSFHRDIDVSVFETNIRVLGGLLSAHQLAVHLTESDVSLVDTPMTSNPTPSLDTEHDHNNATTTTMKQLPPIALQPSPPSPSVPPFYDGKFLLNLAIDLGQRLLPAFNTLTGIPIHRVNLMNGFNENEPAYTCTAAGTSFLLEMGLLSRLSGDPSFEFVARRALKSVWDRRSPLGLVGSLIDINTGAWLGQGAHTSIGHHPSQSLCSSQNAHSTQSNPHSRHYLTHPFSTRTQHYQFLSHTLSSYPLLSISLTLTHPLTHSSYLSLCASHTLPPSLLVCPLRIDYRGRC